MHIVEVPGPTWTNRYPVESIQVRDIAFDLSASNDRLKSWSHYFENIEPELLDWIDGFEPESVFFDLGASIGHFSLYAAIQRQARVVCFEPEAQNFATLELNHFLNRARLPHPVRAFNLALSNVKAADWMAIGHYGAGEHQKSLSGFTRGSGEAGPASHRQAVLCFSLDELRAEFTLPQPRYVKIDVDGSERAVIEGARATLAHDDCRALFIELDENDDGTPETQALIAGCGLTLSEKHPVKRGRGGHYEGLFNCVFAR
ncbi:MAG: FkbM family methyltransferase [Alphaproteobacteria bacterium]|nr:FkbM family methyltransferase [Alphaproteobacteria bacterium]